MSAASRSRRSLAPEPSEFDSQRIFGAALEAFSHPGRTVYLDAAIDAPVPLAPASAAFLLTMADDETTVWLQQPNDALCAYLGRHCGAQLVSEPFDARFAIITRPSAMPALHEFNPGDTASPYQSATLLIQVARMLPSVRRPCLRRAHARFLPGRRRRPAGGFLVAVGMQPEALPARRGRAVRMR